MPPRKVPNPTTTGVHTGTEGGQLSSGEVGAVVMASETGALVVVVVFVSGTFGRLFILVKMKGLTYRKT